MSDAKQLELELIEQGRGLVIKREEAAKLTKELKAAKKAFEDANALLIRTEKTLREGVEREENELRTKMLDYHKETGSKRFEEAFEIRMTPTPEYDPAALRLWLLSAPINLAAELLMVDKKQADAWIKDRADENGGITPLPYCNPIPATVIQKPTAAIISKGLATLPEPKPLVAAVSDVVTISTVPNPTMLLTAPSDTMGHAEIMDALGKRFGAGEHWLTRRRLSEIAICSYNETLTVTDEQIENIVKLAETKHAELQQTARASWEADWDTAVNLATKELRPDIMCPF